MKDGLDANIGKFQNPLMTVNGERRATVSLTNPQTLWFNTGTLCNIECVNCYIESSPTNDALVYISAAEVRDYLGQISERNWPVTEIEPPDDRDLRSVACRGIRGVDSDERHASDDA